MTPPDSGSRASDETARLAEGRTAGLPGGGETQQAVKGWAGQLALVCASDFAVWLGGGMIFPVLPVFLNEQAHASVGLIGLIAGAYFAAVFAFSSPLGRASDRLGRKPLMVAGTALYAVATLLFLTTTDPWLFVVFRFLEGLGAAAVVPAAQAFVAEITTNENRSRAYGWLTTAQFGGLIAGPLLAWPAYQLGGEGARAFYAVFVLGAAVTTVAVIALALFLREPAGAARTRREAAAAGSRPPYRRLLSRPILAIFLVVTTAEYAMGGFEVVWSLWLRGLGFSMQQIWMTIIALSVPMLLSVVGGSVADRTSRFALMVGGFGLQALCWSLLAVTHSFWPYVGLLVISGVAFAFAFPAKQAFLVQVSPRAHLGTIQGMEQSVMQLAALIGTLVTPLLYEWTGGWIWAIAGGVSLAGVIVAAPTLRREWKCVGGKNGVMSCADASRQTDGTRRRQPTDEAV